MGIGGNVCTLEESPFYVFRACARGLLDTVEKLLEEDPSRATGKDLKGWTCMHHAASRDKVVIIDLLLRYGSVVNVTNNDGDTPLHLAAGGNRKNAVRHLLLIGANPNVLNGKHMAPVHLAVIANHHAVLKEMKEHPAVDFNIRGRNGSMPIHYAAMMNLAESTKTLVDAGCDLCSPNNNGFYPIHLAAKNAANKPLEIILNAAEDRGISREKMFSYLDAENNSPLHSAVNGGDFEAVNVCLKNGALVDAKADDDATPFHLACNQGNMEIVQLMVEYFKNKGATNEDGSVDLDPLLTAADSNDHSPLHRAAMFDRSEVVSFLISEGANLEAKDSEGRTPLLLAAAKGSGKSLRVLMSMGASISVRDTNARNVLHFLVSHGPQMIEELKLFSQSPKGKQLLNQQDVQGCTPLHMATRQGNLSFIDSLLQLGATVNTKNNEDQSALHFAARYGRVNTVRRLLDYSGANLINETDGTGMTPLHVASSNGHTKVVQLLLQRGALIHKDFKGQTPLHLAAEKGYTQTMKHLLSYHRNLLDQTDKLKNTALHLSAVADQAGALELMLSMDASYTVNNDKKSPLDLCIEKHSTDSALTMVQHDRWNEFLAFKSHPYGSPLLGLIHYLPDVHRAVLNRCRIKSKAHPASKQYWTMVRFGRVQLLSHPVSLAYLNMKWKAYGFWFFFINLAFYLIFLVSMTWLLCMMNIDPEISPHFNRTLFNTSNIGDLMGIGAGDSDSNGWLADGGSSFTTTSYADFSNTTNYYSEKLNFLGQVLVLFVFIFLLCNFIKEFLQIYQQKIMYFLDLVNIIEWSLYISSMIFVTPFLIYGQMTSYQWQFGSVAVFLSWFNLLMHMQRTDTMGLYVVMFLHISRTVFRVLIVFSVLFIGFGLCFHLLFTNDPTRGFSDPVMSIVEGVMMMMGDWNYLKNFVEPMSPKATFALPFPFLSYLMLLLFVILMPILFINLLIGLAVGDIEMVQKDARLKRLAMQITRMVRSLASGSMEVTKTEGIPSAVEAANLAVMSELNKMKNRQKEIYSRLDKHYELLRLLVQKMEIVSEADHYDEGDSLSLCATPTSLHSQLTDLDDDMDGTTSIMSTSSSDVTQQLRVNNFTNFRRRISNVFTSPRTQNAANKMTTLARPTANNNNNNNNHLFVLDEKARL